MTTLSYRLESSAFSSSPGFQIGRTSSPTISLDHATSDDILWVAHKAFSTPNPRKPESLTVFALHRDSEWDGWCLKSPLVLQLRRVRKQWVASTWLEGVAEYGVADTESEAARDLVVSLGDYREALETRENKLGESARRELARLRILIERSPSE